MREPDDRGKTRVHDPSEDGPEHTTYLTTIRCTQCEGAVTYAHSGPDVPVDMEAPWPDVNACPKCMEPYPEDLAVAIEEVSDLPPPSQIIRGENA